MKEYVKLDTYNLLASALHCIFIGISVVIASGLKGCMSINGVSDERSNRDTPSPVTAHTEARSLKKTRAEA